MKPLSFLLFTLLSAMAATGEIVLVDAAAVSATNLGWGAIADDNAPLQVEDAFEPREPYFAEFSIPLAEAGTYGVWALVIGCDAVWVSDFTWQLDGGTAERAVPQPGSGEGLPRWVRLGRAELTAGDHRLRFTVTGRRRHPDDAYIFALWQVLLAPDREGFTPLTPAVDLGFNPQVNQQGALLSGSDARDAGIRHLTMDRFTPVRLEAVMDQPLPDIQPIWRDYSEGGVVTAPDFFIPELVAPLRPRIIRKDHCMPYGDRRPDGSIEYDYTRLHHSVEAIRAVGAEPVIGLEMQWMVMPHDENGRIPDRKHWLEDDGLAARWQESLHLMLDYLEENELEVHYFQCFNEPEYSGYRDHPELAVWIFDQASRVIRSRRPDAALLGIGAGDGVSAAWHAFSDYLEANPGAADYFDYHTYQATPEYAVERLNWLRDDLAGRGLGHIRPAITEWGLASSGASVHRSGMEAVMYNASQIKALAEAGLEIGCLFCLRDFPHANLKFGLITADGFLKPVYWGQWLWAQLPDGVGRLALKGTLPGVDGVAFRDGDGVALLLWYAADRRGPERPVEFSLAGAAWPGMRIREWRLDEDRHIGWIAPGQTVELPMYERYEIFAAPEEPRLHFTLRPNSMRLIKLQPTAQAGETATGLRNDPELYGPMTP